jgi:uncharacterized membrane-anchored protein
MNAFFLSSFHWRFPKCPMALWLPVLTLFFIQPGWGQDQLSFTSGVLPQENEWVSGPEKTSLGAFATLQIPAGYRFTDAEGARSLLKRMNNPVPAGVIGILAPNSGEWLAVLEFNGIGHVNDDNKDGMNSKVILKAIQDRNEAQNKDNAKEGAATTASVNWESQPVYDEKDHSLEWAIQAETQSGKVINHTVVLLGRRGVLDVTMIKAYQGSSDLFPLLKQLVKNISFNDGQAYADYQKGDKTAGVSLARLVVDDETPAASDDLHASAAADKPVRAVTDNFAWIYYYYYLFGGVVVVVAGLLFFKKSSKRKKHGAVLNGVKLNGVKHGGSNGHIGRRKRGSDFGKFYSSMILELSSPSYGGGHLILNGDSDTHALKTPSLIKQPASDQAFAGDNLELIAIQKNLIEEQRRLMQQQSKLIEEKNRLIEEQNQFLVRQTEVI